MRIIGNLVFCVIHQIDILGNILIECIQSFREFMFFTIIIPSPNNLVSKIDVYMQPLIKELTNLWNDRVLTYDTSLRQNFTMKASLIWTINDFPTYGCCRTFDLHPKFHFLNVTNNSFQMIILTRGIKKFLGGIVLRSLPLLICPKRRYIREFSNYRSYGNI
ncbi:hypothetical protein CR513_24134, partial [Mucuna pruriens]